MSSTSLFEDGEELISSIVHIAPNVDNANMVPQIPIIRLIFGVYVGLPVVFVFDRLMILLNKIIIFC